MKTLKIALAQLNPTMGDIHGNLDLARSARLQAASQKADLVVLTELFISGYPPEDLVLKSAFVSACMQAIKTLAKETNDHGPGILIGTPWYEAGKTYNAVVLLDAGQVQVVQKKVVLPNYGTFDEKRLFQMGSMPGAINFRGVRLGLAICEDAWTDAVCECLVETGAEILLVINGSPYWLEKTELRLQVMIQRVVETGLPLIYVNQVGGQDELVFDGGSFILASDRSLKCQLPQFEEIITTSTLVAQQDQTGQRVWAPNYGTLSRLPQWEEAHWRACVMGLRDYVIKNRFENVVLGLSGGVDSAACAAIAVDALGAERVHCIMLPYHYTSQQSLEDAKVCAKQLGVRYNIVSIISAVEGFEQALAPLFEGFPPDITEENLQSRVRGTLLMALSNKFGSMLMTTGNKSEVSVGYATLYGDMNGGFNPIKDIYKTQLYQLCAWRNSHKPDGVLGPSGMVIPDNILHKAPSAELKENQTDQDSLPPYDVLDDILECLVEHDMSIRQVIARGHEKAVVEKVENLLYGAEYKRRQAAPGVKLSHKNFGRDRRYPIANWFCDRS